ncbi:hypothetical protein K523DRAFT_190451, partial [Schizophyllum commune Tattone D]
HDAHNTTKITSRSFHKRSDHPPPIPLHRDACPVPSTARSSTHRTGEFAVLGSARDTFLNITRPSRPR